ncbi:hypothetical protein C4580_00845 [Candidatus Woesearchaeota archaeon]|nr:MAG: hypothetical protein C4580_00845 [Candidatus Woesearchaeota archaeon]
MKPKLTIPAHAKKAAKLALQIREKLPARRKFGITKEQANKLGIASGVERAKQIIRSSSLPWDDAVRVARFYQRFKNREGPRAQGAIDLWGGRAFGKQAVAFVKKNKTRRHPLT